MLEYKFAYLFLDLIFIPVWLLLFMNRKDLRHKMGVLSALVGFTALISGYVYYSRDYWSPLSVINTPFLLEDFIFGFLFGGIAGVFYEEIFGKKFLHRHTRKHNWALFFVFFVGISAIISNILFFELGTNSMYASLMAFFIAGSGIFIFRKDLIFDALASGIICGCVLFLGYLILLTIYPLFFQAFWQLDNLIGVSLGRIPMEEILWAFAFGMVVGPMYEFYAGLKLRK